jgi:SRSO17 transposase
MVVDWERDLDEWLAPFLGRLQNVAQRRWMPLYVQGLLGPGERKSVEALAERVAPGNTQRLHNFLSASPWSLSPLEALLAEEASFWRKRPTSWLAGRTPSWSSTIRRC